MLSYMYTFDYDDGDSIAQKVEEESSSYEHAAAHVESLASTTDDPELFSSVRMYAIAEKYGITALKDLARGRFAIWIKENWASDNFPAMVEEVFASTPVEDMGLRYLAVEIAAKNMAKLNLNDSWQMVISQNGQLGGMLLNEMTTKQLVDREKLTARIAELESIITVLETENQRIEDEFQTAVTRVNKHRICRHCDTSLNVFFEVGENSTPRCRDCRTRHY